jgi:hypothetical protein
VSDHHAGLELEAGGGALVEGAAGASEPVPVDDAVGEELEFVWAVGDGGGVVDHGEGVTGGVAVGVFAGLVDPDAVAQDLEDGPVDDGAGDAAGAFLAGRAAPEPVVEAVAVRVDPFALGAALDAAGDPVAEVAAQGLPDADLAGRGGFSSRRSGRGEGQGEAEGHGAEQGPTVGHRCLRGWRRSGGLGDGEGEGDDDAPEGQPKVRVSGQPVKVSGLELDQDMILGAQSGAAGGR